MELVSLFCLLMSLNGILWKGFIMQIRNKNFGFTLAEVLITLTIVGVVAAMTLPILINKINDYQFKVAYKKAYRDVNEAYRMMMTTDDEFEEIVCPEGGCFNLAFGRNFKLLAKQFKAVKTCFDFGSKYKCLKCPDHLSHECYSTYASAFIDNSGRVWAMYYEMESPFYVDTNGDKGPNLTGKDRWGFYLPTPRNNNTHKNFIIPAYDYDITTKSRSCTSGDCKYKSWLE